MGRESKATVYDWARDRPPHRSLAARVGALADRAATADGALSTIERIVSLLGWLLWFLG